MKFNRYKNISSSDISSLENEVNTLISKGCKPLGGISIAVTDRSILYVQTVIVEDESNNSLGALEKGGDLRRVRTRSEIQELMNELNDPAYIAPVPRYFSEVKRLALDGQKLAAVKYLMENTEMGLKEAKDWVDNYA